ncbi:hypothetical protein AC579_3650 [Pseudocercospora musae]|uniref:Uncharacterized protein n=1 Tax=Pseudocercospora musae TaxID=113226 RepID=A0A139IT24_9PEZI|nr:hypothetical protein AC579_3650 [Pseudocercospora musae]
MASLPHTSTGLASETPSTSETAVGGHAGGNIEREESAQVSGQQTKEATTGNQPGSAEAAAEKLFEERMEDEYAKREGGARVKAGCWHEM